MSRPISAALLLATACVDHPLVAVELQTEAQAGAMFCADAAPAVDVLLVIDDSASMSDMQELLARGLQRFGDIYDAVDRPLDYRIAVTTTSVANPWCSGDADDGALVARSCRQRGSELVADASHESPAADARASCLETCAFEELPISPTPLGEDDTAKRRPWLEHIGTTRNFPVDVPASALLPCMGLVGIAGCTYEAPLEAAWLALRRASDPDDAAYGFLRHDAALFILFITDEVDCSVQDNRAEIFDPAGDREHWPAGATEPTSAICWNAAMRCDRSIVPHDCEEENDGPLQPVARYQELLRAIELDKQHAAATDAQRVFVHVLGGTAPDHRTLEEMRFLPEGDRARANMFGIGPGCSWDEAVGDDVPAALAHPPGRLRVIADEFAEDVPLHSLCVPEYATALACVPGQLDLNLGCVAACAADVDDSTPELEVDCTMSEHAADATTRTIRECVGDVPPVGEDTCVTWTTGEAMREECEAEGSNVDYALVRPLRRASGTCVEIMCQASQRRMIDCPNMP